MSERAEDYVVESPAAETVDECFQAPGPSLNAISMAGLDLLRGNDLQRREALVSIENVIEELRALAVRLGAPDVPSAPPPPAACDEFMVEGAAARAYRERRIRDRHFQEPRLFGEPAWDILLDLMIAEEQGKRLSVTAACIGAQVPATTALRQIVILEDMGFVIRRPDDADQRRAWVFLTDEGRVRMKSYFAAIAV